MPKPFVVLPYGLQDIFRREAHRRKIICLNAGTGWGKTTAASELLKKQNAVHLSLREGPLRHYFSKEQWVILDDFQELPPQMEPQLQNILKRAPKGQHFVLLSRAPVPEYLYPFEAEGELLSLGTAELALDINCITHLAQSYGFMSSESEIQRIHQETEGYPAAVRFLLLALEAGQPFRQAVEAMRRKVGAYLWESILRLPDLDMRRLLARLALFDDFDLELAELLAETKVTVNSFHILRRNGLIEGEGGLYRIAAQPFLRSCLQEKILETDTAEKIRDIHRVGGCWYEGRQKLPAALYHYRQGDGRADMVRILTHYAHSDPGGSICWELRRYYDALTEGEIQNSPDLLCAMSMLRSAALDPEAAEKWYRILEGQITGSTDQGGDSGRLHGLLAYLSVCLPHRGTAGWPDLLPAVRELISSNRILLPQSSATGGLPSVLRGRKDLSKWVAQEHPDFDTACAVAEAVLGIPSGLIKLEWCMERGEDVSKQFLTLPALKKELRAKGMLDAEFVLAVLLAHIFCTAGNPQKAKKGLEEFHAVLPVGTYDRLRRNLAAVECRISLLEGGVFAEAWFAEQAPDESSFCSLDCCQYLTKVRCYIRREEYCAALLLLSWVLDCAQRYDRTLDQLEALVLFSICRYRMGSSDWQEYFDQALELGAQYSYTTVFTQEGCALLPLLEHFDGAEVPAEYWEPILSGTVAQAGFYPQYLQPPHRRLVHLTSTELKTLRLISQGKSNKEICALMQIKPPTANTHIRNLFRKLNVSSRTEAQKAAKRIGLV